MNVYRIIFKHKFPFSKSQTIKYLPIFRYILLKFANNFLAFHENLNMHRGYIKVLIVKLTFSSFKYQVKLAGGELISEVQLADTSSPNS